jgi:hypothetical protein
LTRAFCALSELDYLKALQTNAASIPLAVFASGAPLVAAAEIFRGQRFFWYDTLFTKRFAVCVLICLTVYHGSRVCFWLYDGTLFDEYLQSGELYRVFVVYRQFFD